MTIVVISGRIGILRACRRRKSWSPATRPYALEVGEHGGRDWVERKTQKKKTKSQA